MKVKRCKKCGVKKLYKDFGNNKSTADGKQPYCILCFRELRRKYERTYKAVRRSKKYKDKNKTIIREYNKQYYIRNTERLFYKRNTESVIIVGNDNKKNINKGRKIYNRKVIKHNKDIVINPQEK